MKISFKHSMLSSLFTLTATTLIASGHKSVAIKGITSPDTWGNYETRMECNKTLQQGDLLMTMVTGREDHSIE